MTSTDKTGVELFVNEVEGGYEATLSDGTHVGILQYEDAERERVFHHTEVPEEFGGRGIATVLIRQALVDSFDKGLTVVPVCPAVRGFVEKFPEELKGEVRLPTAEGEL